MILQDKTRCSPNANGVATCGNAQCCSVPPPCANSKNSIKGQSCTCVSSTNGGTSTLCAVGKYCYDPDDPAAKQCTTEAPKATCVDYYQSSHGAVSPHSCGTGLTTICSDESQCSKSVNEGGNAVAKACKDAGNCDAAKCCKKRQCDNDNVITGTPCMCAKTGKLNPIILKKNYKYLRDLLVE